MSRTLLQELADRIGCDYLSDLKYLPEPDVVKVCMKDFMEDDYPLSEWNQAVCYLTGKRIEFTSAEGAKQYLIGSKLPRLI